MKQNPEGRGGQAWDGGGGDRLTERQIKRNRGRDQMRFKETANKTETQIKSKEMETG